MLVGREAVEGQSDPVPTDPFMMFIAPVERFDNNSGFATPNFCDIRQSVLVCKLQRCQDASYATKYRVGRIGPTDDLQWLAMDARTLNVTEPQS